MYTFMKTLMYGLPCNQEKEKVLEYAEAAARLAELLNETNMATQGLSPERMALGLETAGAVHTEALLASLAAFNQGLKLSGMGTAEQKRETPKGAELQAMPEKTGTIRLDFPLPADGFSLVSSSHIPKDGWERWYVESEGPNIDGSYHLFYYRNASGYLFFDALVEKDGDGYIVTDVVVNQDDKQYTETNLAVCAAQLKILLANDLGIDDEPYWDEMDAAGE